MIKRTIKELLDREVSIGLNIPIEEVSCASVSDPLTERLNMSQTASEAKAIHKEALEQIKYRISTAALWKWYRLSSDLTCLKELYNCVGPILGFRELVLIKMLDISKTQKEVSDIVLLGERNARIRYLGILRYSEIISQQNAQPSG